MRTADGFLVRIALAAEGTRGDLAPLLALGDSLLALGHRVVVCAPPNFRAAAAARGMEFRAVGIDIRAYLTERGSAIVGGGLAAVREANRYLEESLRLQFRALPAATRDVDRVVGAGIQLAGPSAAELRGISYRYVVYCPALLPSAEHAPVTIPWQGLPRWAHRLAWWLTLAYYDRRFRDRLDRQRAELGLGPVKAVYAHVLGARPLLAADPELAPAPRDGPVEVEQIRCLHPFDGEELPAKLASFLEQGPPPVYFGFGSMTDPDPGRTTREILRAVASLGCRALISEGWAGLGGGPLPEGVCAVGPVSHARLFPRTAAVVHHGGAGTTATAARAGVPQIVIPHVADQFYWAARVGRLGLGPPPLPRHRFCGPRLAAALSSTLENELLGQRARELGERLRLRDSSEPDPALRLLED